MSSVVSIVVVLLVEPVLVYTVPRSPIHLNLLLHNAKESTVDSTQTESVVDLQRSTHEETITQEYISSLSQTSVFGSERKLMEMNLVHPTRSLLNSLGISVNYRENQTNRDGKKQLSPLKLISNDGTSSILTKDFPKEFLDSWEKTFDTEKMVEVAEPRQMTENEFKEIMTADQSSTSDDAYKSSNDLGKEFISPNAVTRLKHESIAAPALADPTEPRKDLVAVVVYDPILEVLFPNILAQQSIEALVNESADVLQLDSLSSSALERLLPPFGDNITTHDNIGSSKPTLSLGLNQELDAEPVKTIMNLWESDEYEKLISDTHEYEESISTTEKDYYK